MHDSTLSARVITAKKTTLSPRKEHKDISGWDMSHAE